MRLVSLGVILAFALVVLWANAQDRPTFSTRSELVVLHVTVEDRKGTYVSGLPQDAFTVFEDNRRQDLRFFSAADTPATIGLIVDNSTSMADKRELVVAAAVGFTQLSNPEDEFFVLAFNENVTEIWAPKLIKETNLASLRATLLGNIAARGKTALFDAVTRGLARLENGKHTRQVLVVVSDGTDNASTTTLDDMLSKTQSSEAAIFAVALRDPIAHEDNPKLLRRMASETGGEAFVPDYVDEIPKALAHIARDIRSAYTIGYEPRGSAKPELRRLRVAVRTKDGKTMTARTRSGYLTKAQS